MERVKQVASAAHPAPLWWKRWTRVPGSAHACAQLWSWRQAAREARAVTLTPTWFGPQRTLSTPKAIAWMGAISLGELASVAVDVAEPRCMTPEN